MPPNDGPSSTSQSPEFTTQTKEILVDEDALSPRMQAQIEVVGSALGVVMVGTLLVRAFRATGRIASDVPRGS